MFNLTNNEYIAKKNLGVTRSSHIQTIKCHPSSAIRLTQVSTRGEWLRTVKDADIIKSKKSSLEYIVPPRILAVDPPQKRQSGVTKE